MNKQIIDHGFGIIETRETFYTEETISKLNQQIAELQKQLDKDNKYFNSLGCDNFDEFTDFISSFMLTPHQEQTLIKDLKQQLKSQPAEIMEKIKERVLKIDKTEIKTLDNGYSTLYCDRPSVITILDTILKDYQK